MNIFGTLDYRPKPSDMKLYKEFLVLCVNIGPCLIDLKRSLALKKHVITFEYRWIKNNSISYYSH